MSISAKNDPNRKKTASLGGKSSQEKREKSGYYQSQEWKDACKRGWEKRRAAKV